jgi:hypothetical protein
VIGTARPTRLDFPPSAFQTGRVSPNEGTRQAPATPGDRPSLPLETEPLLFFHALGAGDAVPGPVQPVPGLPLLEEEPSIWPELPA